MRRSLSLAALAACLAAGPVALARAAAPPSSPPTPLTNAVDPSLLAGMKARSIGPAAMSGRIAAIEAVEADPEIIYVGGASSGVWKSTNGGLTWAPIFDDQPVHSIGAIAVYQANPDIVWVGTGEGNPRNSTSVGNGVYRSLDAGRTWEHIGLDKTERIRRIVLHPTDPNIAWVAAEGREWGENPERGIFKTVDAGKSWKRVLYADERSGGSELVIDPQNPNKLFATLWDYRRWPWFFRSGGPGSGLYITNDGGDTWKRLTDRDGLPKGNLGRMGVAIARSQPNVVYALVENSGNNVMLRSEDGGKSWQTAGSDIPATERPFYYAEIRVDPQWPNRLYDLTSRLRISDDSAKTFHSPARAREIHGDYHALWIDPRDPRYLIIGEDGGVGISHDRGETWQFAGNLPFGQYYHVAVDNDDPYHIYGGLQDNGCWRGPSAVWEPSGIRNAHWQILGGGDGFLMLPDPNDSLAGYSEAQGGELQRYDIRNNRRKELRPAELSTDHAKRLRFNWNTGLAIDPFDASTIYYGSQYLLRSTDRGENWAPISPDLTTNNPDWQHQDQTGGLTLDASGAENYCTIIAIAPSAAERGVIWVGTDDGRVQVTRDAGKTWTSVEGNIQQAGAPGVPAHTWVPQIRAGKFGGGQAFVVFDDHRRSNWTPYVYRTDDYGKTWKSLATPNLWGYALAIDQDPVDPDLLFLGTEFGLYMSLDAGNHWLPWKHGIPTVSAMDLIVHPRAYDLVVATHGRSIFVIDDITPLRQMSAATLAEPLHVYQGMPARQHRVAWGPGAYQPGAGEFQGENRPYGAILTYSLNLPNLPLADEKAERERLERARGEEARKNAPNAAVAAAAAAGVPAPPPDESASPAREAAARQSAATAGTSAAGAAGTEAEEPESEGMAAPPAPTGRPDEPQVEIRITDSAGKVIRTLKGPARLGVNRAVWDLGRDAFRQPPRSERGGFFRRDSGPQVAPGTYGMVIRFRGHEAKGSLEVLPDASAQNSAADWQAREAAFHRAGELQNALVEAIERLGAVRTDLDAVIGKLRRADAHTRAEERKRQGGGAEPSGGSSAAAAAARPKNALLDSAQALRRRVAGEEKKLFQAPGIKGIVEDHSPFAVVQNAISSLDSSWDAPNGNQRIKLQQADEAATAALAAVNKFLAGDVEAFRQQVAAAHLDLMAEPAVEAPPAH